MTDHLTPTSRRFFLAAFGDPGHAFPILALGERLVQRGHTVCVETWSKWESYVRASGMEFAAAPEYPVFPTRDRPLKPFQAVLRAAQESRPAMAAFSPDVVVHDILTQAPALSAELEGVAVATVVPHVYPHLEAHFPLYSIGARLPRTAVGRRFWRSTHRVINRGLELGRDELNETRRRLGLPARDWLFNGISRELTLIATVPQLEYPRTWPNSIKVVGPLLWEPPVSQETVIPAGDEPLILIAPSTSQDPEHKLLRNALTALEDLPVRVIATHNGRGLDGFTVPKNATLLPWLSYKAVMPMCDLVICHGGHGTVVRALASDCPLLVLPVAGDMNENAARVAWAGLGYRLPSRFQSASAIRYAVRDLLRNPEVKARVSEVAQWIDEHDGADTACVELELR